MPKVTQAHLDARRLQILLAACRCFSRQGFHRTTMQDIVRASRLSPGAIYRYFKGKDQIVAALTEKRLEWWGSKKLSAVAQNSARGALVTDLLHAFFLPLQADAKERASRHLIIQVWAEALRNPGILRAVRKNMNGLRALVAGIIAQGQQRGEIRSDLDPGDVARVMLGLLQAFMLHEALEPHVDADSYFHVIEMAFAMLRADSESAPSSRAAPQLAVVGVREGEIGR